MFAPGVLVPVDAVILIKRDVATILGKFSY
jgi:hypothetical protein